MLRAFGGDSEPPEAEPEPVHVGHDRKPVEGEPGIYSRQAKSGVVTYYVQAGSRFKRVNGGLEAARKLRDEGTATEQPEPAEMPRTPSGASSKAGTAGSAHDVVASLRGGS